MEVEPSRRWSAALAGALLGLALGLAGCAAAGTDPRACEAGAEWATTLCRR